MFKIACGLTGDTDPCVMQRYNFDPNNNFVFKRLTVQSMPQDIHSVELLACNQPESIDKSKDDADQEFLETLPIQRDHNVKLNPNIKHAFQALALDEHGEAFSPTLWHLPEAMPREEGKEDLTFEEQLAEKQNSARRQAEAQGCLQQSETRTGPHPRIWQETPNAEASLVSIPGVHINIGGGSSDSLEDEGDPEEMANITFSWVLDQISSYVSIDHPGETLCYRLRQNHMDELNDEQHKYDLEVAQDEKEAAK
ncbi:hypothetical protein KCU89_g5040, partial [Aureobasidium melanogenum]